ncbi:MAG TPA: VWA domain-containing protein [Longimicrobiales bacterium]|nr:VWA domain-containing protein [Longimicrobiales bacterium]
MSFDRPDLLWLAMLLPAAAAVLVLLYARRRRRVAHALGESSLLERLGGRGLAAFPWRRLLLIVPAAAALGFAALGPRWGTRDVPTESRSANVVLAMDISKSMLAPDVAPDRLERARLLARRIVREMRTDRIGLVVFAGRAYVLSPLTTDHGALDLYLDALDPEIVSQGGSSLAAALAQSTDLARGRVESGGDRAVVLVSDGEALEEEDAVRDAAERAARAGVRVFTVGVGTASGSPIPDYDESGRRQGYKRDENGEVVISRLGTELLRDVAGATDARYFDLGDPGAAGALIRELRQLEQSTSDTAQRATQREQYAWFVALALLLLALDAWLVRREARPARAAAGLDALRAEPVPSRGPRRRLGGARTAAALALMLVMTGFGIGDVERGNRMYREGRYEEAVAAYQQALADGESSPELHYNLGTAFLALRRYAEAERHLQLALRDVDPILRQHAYYNLGNRFLEAARAGSDPQAQSAQYEAAIEAYRHALRLAPDDVDAKWNLELAQRERDEQQPEPQPQEQDQQEQDNQNREDEQQAREQEGQAQPSQGQAGQGQQSGSRFEQQPMSREQAEQILSAVEQDERDLTRDKLRKGQRRTPVARDW